jgi:hypothetical protein
MTEPDADARTVTLALRREDAARVIGASDETFDRYVRPTLPVVRLGSVRVYPVAALEAWLLDRAESLTDELRERTTPSEISTPWLNSR